MQIYYQTINITPIHIIMYNMNMPRDSSSIIMKVYIELTKSNIVSVLHH
jgi:hypothetical protein